MIGLCRALLLTGLLAAQSVMALPWSKDMRDQPSVKAQESQVETVNAAVPTTGKERFGPPADMSELVQERLQAGQQLTNAVATTPESINRGKEMYDRHCALCHGSGGQGDGQVGAKFIPSPMNLTINYVQLQPDGQLYFTISHGSIAMPFYRNAIDPDDRWNIVNYVKEVLGKESPGKEATGSTQQ